MTRIATRGLPLLAVLALVLGMFLALFAFNGGTAQANPPGAPDNSYKLAFKFNYIAVPPGTDVGCGQGHRVFTERGAGGQHILWTLDTTDNPHVVDCGTESIDGDVAHIHTDQENVYKVFVRILGPNVDTNTLNICRNVLTEDETIGIHDELCELGEISLERRGVDRFIFPKKLFADGFQEEPWHQEQGNKFRIAEVWLYEYR